MMQEDWKTLLQGNALAGPSELRVPRAQAIADAIFDHPDYTLVR